MVHTHTHTINSSPGEFTCDYYCKGYDIIAACAPTFRHIPQLQLLAPVGAHENNVGAAGFEALVRLHQCRQEADAVLRGDSAYSRAPKRQWAYPSKQTVVDAGSKILVYVVGFVIYIYKKVPMYIPNSQAHY